MVIVSHSEDVVREMCTRAVWLDSGETRMEGEANAVLDAYLASTR
jgi:ABC-type polysaccharide/polyol phosphate transport system ATPase subunit